MMKKPITGDDEIDQIVREAAKAAGRTERGRHNPPNRL